MNGRIILGILLVIVLVAGAVGLGVSAYNMGVAQGMAVSGADKAPAAGVVPYPQPNGRNQNGPPKKGYG